MRVRIIKPDVTLFDGDASSAQLPGVDGLFEILNNHAPIIAMLSQGQVRLHTAEGEQQFAIHAGVVRVRKNEVLVLIQ